MTKMNLKKMVLAAAMAAFMVYAPAMAEEDIIIDETTEMAAEITAETEAAAEIGFDVQVVAVVEAEVPAEVAQAAEQAQTEANAGAQSAVQSFFFENEEVVIRAEGELPVNAEMVVTKLEEGSAAYEEAKAAAEAVYGADASAEYKFYDVIFVANGAEVETAEDSVNLQVEFKAAANGQQSVMEIEDGEVTAQNGTAANFAI